MHDEDAHHPNKSLQEKLEHIFSLRKGGRVNFEDNRPYLELLQRLGNPHRSLPSVLHLAGTNGKGSTLATLRSMLEAGRYSVNAYTSPHLRVFNERLYLGGQNISDQMLEAALDHLFEVNDDLPVSFFEFTTALAFYVFANTPSDITLLETGMGGRLDCTNVIEAPLATIITPISYDHMEFLGDTLPKIAFEKAGIMKRGAPCIVSAQNSEVVPVFERRAKDLGCPLYVAGTDYQISRLSDQQMTLKADYPIIRLSDYPLPSLLGAHQIQNSGAALVTLDVISDRFPVSKTARDHGLQNIRWPGRMERITSGPYSRALPKEEQWELWFDGAHNVGGAKAAASGLKYWEKHDPKPLHILLAMKENKDIEGVVEVLSPFAASLTRFKIGKDVSALIKECTHIHPSNTPARLLICGSLYIYG